MIVLDTNVMSEPLKRHPDERVITWLEQLDERTAITAVTVGELLTGVRALPEGRRRNELLDAVVSTLADRSGAVLPYDEPSAQQYARLQEVRRSMGRPLSVEDGMIAAICLVHDAALATRDTLGFEGLGVALIDPWAPQTGRAS